MKNMNAIMAIACVIGTISGASAAFAADEYNVSTGTTVDGQGVALRGNDSVALFTGLDVTPGHAKFTVVHDNVAYYFSSEETMKKFKADPAAFIPQYGGFCAFGVAKGLKLDGSPRFADVVDGKLYLFLNADVFEAELASVTRMIELEARQTTQAVEQLHARWQARYQALAAMQRASERTRRAWELGEADLSEYLLAQRNHRQAQLDETQTRVDALEAIQRVHVDSHELWHPELAEETAASPGDLPRL